MSNVIPPITEPLGRHWKQPPLDQVHVYDHVAFVTQQNMDLLLEYSTTRPTGVYPGKMWKGQMDGKWWLLWYGIVEHNPNVCSNNCRELLVMKLGDEK